MVAHGASRGFDKQNKPSPRWGDRKHFEKEAFIAKDIFRRTRFRAF
jgi:hypothetical protein